jgi:hypothetical protein
LFEGGVEIFDDFLGENVGIEEIVGFFEAFGSEPEDVSAGKRPPTPFTRVFVLRRAGCLHGVSNYECCALLARRFLYDRITSTHQPSHHVTANRHPVVRVWIPSHFLVEIT